MSPEQAARWIVRAVERKPARVGTLLGEAVETASVLLPDVTARWTGRLFRYMGGRRRGAGTS
jgi:hypothetical protein